MSAIIGMLAKSMGPMLAEYVVGQLLKSKGAKSKMQRVIDAVGQGMSIIAALRAEFGDDFLKAITSGVGSKGQPFAYEAGGVDYIKLSEATTEQDPLVVLRDELNINIDRLVLIGDVPEPVLLNYFRGTMGVWRRRYTELAGTVEGETQVFDVMDNLLDGRTRSFKDALETISKTSLGGVGALLVISGVLLATGTGIGLATSISMFLFGIPWMTVGALVIPGAILIGLSRYTFGAKHAMSTCVKMAYKLLEKRLNMPAPDKQSEVLIPIKEKIMQQTGPR